MNTRVLAVILACLWLSACCARRAEAPAADPPTSAAGMDPARQAMAARAFDITSGDERREGILEVSQQDWGRREPMLAGYAALAGDREPIVRSAAVVALGRGRDPAYLPVLLEILEKDPVEYVRVDAAEALSSVRGPSAAGPLARHARQDASLDVRLRCIRALRHYRQRQAIEALLACLGDREFGVCFVARRTLTKMTGQDAGYDADEWSRLLKDTP